MHMYYSYISSIYICWKFKNYNSQGAIIDGVWSVSSRKQLHRRSTKHERRKPRSVASGVQLYGAPLHRPLVTDFIPSNPGFFFLLLFLFFLAIYKHNSLILSLREKRYLMLGTARNGGVRHVGDDARWARGDPNKRLACSGGQWCCKLWDGSVSAEPAMTPRFCESESIYIYIYRGFNGSDDYQMMHIKRYIIVLMKVLYESSGEERRRRRRRFCMKIYQNFGCYVHNSRLIWSISPSK